MGETSSRVKALSDTEIILTFRDALVALSPVLSKLDLIESSSGYDDFDELAESLWEILVVRSLMWKYGLDSPPSLPRYGFTELGADGHIQVTSRHGTGRFVEFVNLEGVDTSPFSVAVVLLPSGSRRDLAVDESVEFTWSGSERTS